MERDGQSLKTPPIVHGSLKDLNPWARKNSEAVFWDDIIAPSVSSCSPCIENKKTFMADALRKSY